jgi:para-nitrobenzyl esterase
VGERRWRAPEPVAAWEGMRPATAFGNSCMQTKNPMFGTGDIVTSEDCLFINVWTPVKPNQATRLPVMVWMIYGGDFSFGTTTQAIYSGERLAVLW